MKTILLSLMAGVSLINTATPDPENLELMYTFEIVRHGARSPILEDMERFDIVPDVGLLTP